ncbi:hypothetical protein [Pseudoalteromonas sp. Of7M-16]|uniref:hypothetical protein n=1 Tax=Pseudoalteromonas sp. Of7M-16 TaxID=2917756 RepID=UPI001EF488C9|nr:hypothetical protein [Pseudoalteromonas sp. Of7M-16]MCG7546970.1 hypothetical protein [Pseudoalteromonas sp. Of7M-16]
MELIKDPNHWAHQRQKLKTLKSEFQRLKTQFAGNYTPAPQEQKSPGSLLRHALVKTAPMENQGLKYKVLREVAMKTAGGMTL